MLLVREKIFLHPHFTPGICYMYNFCTSPINIFSKSIIGYIGPTCGFLYVLWIQELIFKKNE
jgi:hypothetical protein